MKRIFIFAASVLVVLLVLFNAAGCRRIAPARSLSGNATKQKKEEGKINVTSVIFPSYDFVRAIAGDKVNLALLLSPGAESHSFEPGPLDIIDIRESDLFIYSGSENTKWMDRILNSGEINESRMKIIKLIDLVEGLKNEDDEHDDGHDDHHEDAAVWDEHVWTSPRNAKLIVAAITEALCELDGANADFYRNNSAEYSVRLDELDAVFRLIVEGAKRNTIIFADRFPFRYFAEAYGLEYFAAFPGCSAEAEPSAATVAFLINKVKSEQIPVVFYIELSNKKMADIISEETGAKKLLLHSAHNVTKKDFDAGANYLDLQKANAVNLKEALW